MVELVQLESHREQWASRGVKVVAVSVEGVEDAKQTKADFPSLTVVADEGRSLSEAVDVIHANSNPQGGDTAAPTTLLIDGTGKVRWAFRPDRVFDRLSPEQLMAEIDRVKGPR